MSQMHLTAVQDWTDPYKMNTTKKKRFWKSNKPYCVKSKSVDLKYLIDCMIGGGVALKFLTYYSNVLPNVLFFPV